jgi:hypothetical protein
MHVLGMHHVYKVGVLLVDEGIDEAKLEVTSTYPMQA